MRNPFALSCVVLLGLVLTGVATAGNGGVAPPNPESPTAARIEDIYWLLLAVSGAIFLLVEGALIVFIVRFRSRGRSRELEGPQVRGNTRLELIWTAVPVLILAGIVSFVLYKLPGIRNVPPASAQGGRLEVKVEGHQFYWEFVYPNGVVQVNRMRVPVGRPVAISITSPDVDHSWWIPSLQGKFDAIPGKTNRTWFRVERPGTFKGQCGEFCGIQHAAMLASVEGLPAPEFDRWLAAEASAQAAGTSDLGAMTFRGACATCHGFRAQGDIGPSLDQNPLLNDKRALATVIRQGRGRMPAVGATWNDRQLNATIAYLQRRFGPKQGGSTGGG